MALSVSAAASESDALARVQEAIRDSSGLESDIRALCDSIGSRMAGSRGMRDATGWALESFADAGLENTRIEAVPVPLRWQEVHTLVEVVAPREIRVRAAASALSPGIPDGIEAELVDGGSGRSGAISGNKKRFRSRILLVELDEARSFEDLAKEQLDAMVAFREAADAGAAAVLFVSTRANRLLYRHVNNIAGRIDTIPSAIVAREDGLRLLRLLRGGERVRVRLVMRNQIGPAFETSNVVAEIPGVHAPEEIVLLGAHLDSWDLGDGCLDNAVNAALVLHVARAMQGAGARPRRTVRFVLFGAEELGLFGSLAYVGQHRDELSRHVAAIVHDMGDGPLVGYSLGGRDELQAGLSEVLDSRMPAASFRHSREAFFLSDNFTFVLQGVPALFAVQDTSSFFLTYHSEADTFDKVRIGQVTESAVVAAVTALGIADREARFGTRLPEREVLRWLRRTGLDRHLRFLGVWDSWRPARAPGAASRDTAGAVQ